jgi:hypothetical protein
MRPLVLHPLNLSPISRPPFSRCLGGAGQAISRGDWDKAHRIIQGALLFFPSPPSLLHFCPALPNSVPQLFPFNKKLTARVSYSSTAFASRAQSWTTSSELVTTRLHVGFSP